MKDFRRLLVWQKSHELTLATYDTTASFPKREMFALCMRMRRSSASIPTNIAEGCGRQANNSELHRFLQIAAGSASELEYQFLLARDLKFIAEPDYERLNANVCEVKRMLSSLMAKLYRDRTAAER